MRKIALLTGIACITAANASAIELNPYAGIRLSAVQMQNDAKVLSDYSFSGVTHHENEVASEKHKDTIFGARIAGGIGTDIIYGKLRGELELGWNSDSKDDNNFDFTIINSATHNFETKTSVYDAMLNFYYDLNTGTKFSPFIGAGLGYAHLKVKTTTTGEFKGNVLNLEASDTANNFAWNVGAGVSYQVSDAFAIDLAYRYTDYGSVKETAATAVKGLGAKVNTDAKFDVISHEIMLGARYSF